MNHHTIHMTQVSIKNKILPIHYCTIHGPKFVNQFCSAQFKNTQQQTFIIICFIYLLNQMSNQYNIVIVILNVNE